MNIIKTITKNDLSLRLFSKLFSILVLFCLITGCSSSTPPADTTPLTNWTTPQLVSKGKEEFANKNYNESVKYLYEAAKRDDKEALYALGFMHYHGLSLPINPKRAQDLIRRSAELGYEPAIKALRLFITTRSQFTVNEQNPTYLAKNQKPEVKQQDANTKEIAKTSTKLIENNRTTVQTNVKPPVTNTITKLKEKTSTPKLTKMSIVDTSNTKTSKVSISDKTNELSKVSSSNISSSPVSQLSSIDLKKLNQKWLYNQSPDSYTIQVLADDEIENIDRFITRNHLENKLNTFSYYFKDKLWFGASYGIYKNSQDAYNAMLNDIPSELASKKPWVRQIQNINKQQKSFG